MPPRSDSSNNGLLAALSPSDFAFLERHFEQVPLKRRAKLEYGNRRIEHVYFIESGVASVVASQGSMTVEIGIIGREGVTGLAIINGNDRSPYTTFMQVPGDARRISAERFRDALERPELRRLFGRFAQAFMIQTSQTAVANARATIEERLARWLLMAHDRGDGDELEMTHEFLSMMLGAGRPGVTEGIHALARRGLIRSERGQLTVLDRAGLIERAGSYYGVPESEYRRLIPEAKAALRAG